MRTVAIERTCSHLPRFQIERYAPVQCPRCGWLDAEGHPMSKREAQDRYPDFAPMIRQTPGRVLQGLRLAAAAPKIALYVIVIFFSLLLALGMARVALGDDVRPLHHSPRAHISVAQAERAVIRYYGHGTTASCHRASPHSAICDYSLPEAGGLVVIEDGGPPPGPWEGICRVIVQRGRYRVSSPL